MARTQTLIFEFTGGEPLDSNGFAYVDEDFLDPYDSADDYEPMYGQNIDVADPVGGPVAVCGPEVEKSALGMRVIAQAQFVGRVVVIAVPIA